MIKKVILFIAVIFSLVSTASATSYFNITNDIPFNLDNGANITLTAGQNFSNTSEPVVRTYNSTDVPSSTLELNFNNTQARWNTTINTTLSSITYTNDKLSFTGVATSGKLNISVKMQNVNASYGLYVDSTLTTTTSSNSSGWLSFSYSGWSSRIFLIQAYTALSSTTTRSSGTSGGYTPEGLEELEESRSLGRKDYSFRIIFDGSDGQVEPPKSEEHGITALNLFFKTPVKGTYTFILSTYTDFKPRLNGSLKYFSISPTFDLKPTSSIELISEAPMELYQLYGETWKKLPKGTKVSRDRYRFPITSFGVFAVKQATGQSVVANIVQEAKKNWLGFDLSFKNIEQKDREMYEMLKVKLAWLVEVVDGIKALISEKLNNLT